MTMLLLTAMLQVATPTHEPDIVVSGTRERSAPDRRENERHAARDVDQILPQSRPDQPLARFQGTLCPGVVGLAASSAQAVIDRIASVADTLGLPIGRPGCDPNLLVAVTADAHGTIRDLIARRPGLFQGQDLAAVRRLRAETGGARGWTAVELRNRDGQRTILDNQGPPTLLVPTAGRAGGGFRYDIVNAVVVIDAAAARRRDTDQIADYAVMRGLADARPERLRHARTVLAAFGALTDAAAPPCLTTIDWAILRALYAGRGDRPGGIVRGAMTTSILTGDGAADQVVRTGCNIKGIM